MTNLAIQPFHTSKSASHQQRLLILLKVKRKLQWEGILVNGGEAGKALLSWWTRELWASDT